jgi:ASC-1-like (ASCH) protein
MIHYMNLHSLPFEMIAARKKTIELRLLDEKRQKIAVGDCLVFTNTTEPERQLRCVVRRLHRFTNFAELYATLPLDQCGYLPEELADARPEDMDLYYPPEKQKQYGVVGIELERIV